MVANKTRKPSRTRLQRADVVELGMVTPPGVMARRCLLVYAKQRWWVGYRDRNGLVRVYGAHAPSYTHREVQQAEQVLGIEAWNRYAPMSDAQLQTYITDASKLMWGKEYWVDTSCSVAWVDEER